MTIYDPFFRTAQVLALLEPGPIVGRRRFQKIAYLAGLPAEWVYAERGPYAFDLDLTVVRLSDDGLIAVHPSPDGTVYRIEARGRAFLRRLLADGIPIVIRQEIVTRYRDDDPDRLEYAASVLFLVQQGMDERSAIERIRILQPHLGVIA